jgi:ATP-dependent DNA helicase RecQ
MAQSENKDFDDDAINQAFDIMAEDEFDLLPTAPRLFTEENTNNNKSQIEIKKHQQISQSNLASLFQVDGPPGFQRRVDQSFDGLQSGRDPQQHELSKKTLKQFQPHELEEALNHFFEFPSFRDGQKEVIEAVLAGRDVMAIMPTSAGKSLLFQLPALMLPGVTLVISPLISLMKDQVDKLKAKGLPADFINSSLTDSQRRHVIELVESGDTKLLFVAPERFRSGSFKRTLKGLNISLFAVDEAHCVSSWGHDFRPDYLKLSRAVRLCGRPPILAVTATATENVRKDIEIHLALKDDYYSRIAGFDRPNLRFDVQHVASDEEKISAIANLARNGQGTGIVYCSTRKNTEKVVASLNKAGLDASAYHAGIGAESRRLVQEDFMAGKIPLVCATNAFGLGIDKEDVRFVAHYNLPSSVEAYYQEAGRAGRDGKPSDCLLLFRSNDVFIQEFFIEMSYPAKSLVEAVYRELRRLDNGTHELTLAMLKERIKDAKSEWAISAAQRLLEEAGHIDRGGRLDNPARIRQLRAGKKGSKAASQILFGQLIKAYGQKLEVGISETLPDLVYTTGATVEELRRMLPALREGGYIEYHAPFAGRSVTVLYPTVEAAELKVDYSVVKERRRRDQERLQRIIALAYSPTCRRAYILKYFGAPYKENCANCDICKPAAGTAIPRALTDSELITLKKVLSCVIRMKGKFGKAKVVQVLRGSRAKDIKDHRLDGLSTHGILRDWSREALSAFMGECIKRQLVSELRDDQGRYPKALITELGREVLFDRQRVQMVIPGSQSNKRSHSTGRMKIAAYQARQLASGEDEELFQALRQLRMKLSLQRKVEPFRVFPDRTLRNIAQSRPQSRAELAGLPGIGPAKLRQFGKIIVNFIKSYEGP